MTTNSRETLSQGNTKKELKLFKDTFELASLKALLFENVNFFKKQLSTSSDKPRVMCW